MSKIINGASTSFLYDGVNPVQEQSTGGQNTNLLTGLDVDEYFTRTDVAWQQNFLSDGVGSAVALADGTGSPVTQYTYEPFGRSAVTGAATTNSFQFTRRENDGADLHYYRARYYSAKLQRFISEDPIQFEAGINFYTYAFNDPVDLVDPSGLLVEAYCEPVQRYYLGYIFGFLHCRLRVKCDEPPNPFDNSFEWLGPGEGIFAERFNPARGGTPGKVVPPPDNSCCEFEKEIVKVFVRYLRLQNAGNFPEYGLDFTSNTFVERLVTEAGGKITFPPGAVGGTNFFPEPFSHHPYRRP